MTKVVHNLIQGSPEWQQFRLEHFGASEAASMLGLSKKVTRTELLHMKSTGTAKEFSDWVQKNILDYGHEVEAMARPIIEEIFGIDLYPVTCSDGRLSASCDGLTLCETIAFEHKQWNQALASAVGGGELPDEYMPQCQQVLMVTGAEKVIFTVSDGTSQKMAWVEIEPDQEWFNRIRAGWEQFKKDFDEFVYVTHSEKPEAEAVMQLPALSIQSTGHISIISNLDLFGQKLNEFVGNLDLEPTDDQGFANAEAAVKTLQKAQDALEAAEASALAQAADVDEMRRTVALYADTARKTRIMLEKMVKARKEQIKAHVITKAKEAFEAHIEALEEEIKPLQVYQTYKQPDFIGAAKNKRTLASLHDAVETALANAKIAADATAKDVRAKLAWHKENAKGHGILFPDLQQIIQKPADDFQMVVQNRILQHKADEAKKLEAERVRIQAEEEVKARAKVVEIQKVPAPVVVESRKPGPVNSSSSVNSALIALARHELVCFRKKFAPIKELVGVMEQIDLYLAATADQRQTVEA